MVSGKRNRVGSILANVPMLDIFGDSVNVDPARFPKTFEGVFASILFIGIAVVLIVFDIIRLVNSVSEVQCVLKPGADDRCILILYTGGNELTSELK